MTGKYNQGISYGTRFSKEKTYIERYWNKQNIVAIEKIDYVARKYGMDIKSVAIKKCVENKNFDSCIIGVSAIEQLKEIIELSSCSDVPEEINNQCEEEWINLSGKRQFYGRYFRREL